MSETLTSAEAARLVARAQRWEGSLRQRTEGITWMVWGIATAAMFLTYEWAGTRGAPDWSFAVLWIPWVLAGNMTSYALWRSAALTRDPDAPTLGGRRHVGLIVVFVLVFASMSLLRPTSWSVPMALVGVVWSVLGLLVPGMSRTGRLVSAVVGLAVAAVALLLTAVDLTEPIAGILAATSVGFFALCGGLWQTLHA